MREGEEIKQEFDRRNEGAIIKVIVEKEIRTDIPKYFVKVKLSRKQLICSVKAYEQSKNSDSEEKNLS